MPDNPYETPSIAEQVAAPKVAAPSWGIPSGPVLVGVGVLALITGLSFFYVIAGGLPENVLVPLVFGCPAAAVLLMSLAGAFPAVVRPGGRIIRRGFGLFFLSLVAAVAGYIAFATTCCCVNGMAIGPNYSPPPGFGGTISFVSVVIGALTVAGLHGLARKVFGTPTVEADTS